MKYETHDFPQGSPEWLNHRGNCYNASELAAAAGESQYKTHDQLIHELATGEVPEVSEHKQRMFDDGHRFEALARPLAEELIGEELFPSVVSAQAEGLSRRLGASFDGKTMADDITWEHKSLNDNLAQSLDAGEIPHFYHWQMEQGMLICGAAKCLFTASKWDKNDQLVDIKHVWYESNPELRAKIIPTWKQAEADAAAYRPVEVIPAAVAVPTEGFGALVLQVEGRVVASNMDAFRAGAAAFLARLPKPDELNSDQDFANADSAAKACAEAESKIKAAKDAGLAQMNEVDTVFRVADQIIAEIKAARVALERSVEARKTSIRAEIVQSGKDRLAEHIDTLNKRLGRVQMPVVPADFAGAIKSKRTVESMRNAVDTTLANAKVAASEIADKIQINLATLDEHAEHAFLFNDLASLVMKPNDDMRNIIKLRIAEHQAEQEKKLEAQREQIRKEEQDKAHREAAAAPALQSVNEAITREFSTPEPTAKVVHMPSNKTTVERMIESMSAQEVEELAAHLNLWSMLDAKERSLTTHYIERLIGLRQASA